MYHIRRSLWAAPRILAVLLLPILAGATDPAGLSFSELYKGIGVLGLQFSDKVLGLNGKPVSIRGFMAPPLKPEADFFVLTKEPVALCPFCQSDADWPTDILVVYLRSDAAFTSNTDRIEVNGTLEVGSKTDGKTGFVSLLRIVNARFRRV
jgi:hypothetical protein